MKKIGIITKINYIFTKKQKLSFLGLLILMFIGAILELMGVSMVMPFVSIVTNPDKIQTSRTLQTVSHLFNIKDEKQFLILIAASLIGIYVIKNIYGIWMYSVQCRFIYRNQMRMSARLMDCYMHQPYVYHVQKNSAELQRSILTDVQRVFALIMACIQLFSELLVALLLCLYLFSVDIIITLTIALLLCICMVFYLCIYRKKIAGYGRDIQYYGGLMIKSINQAFSGIKDIKVLGREEYFVDSYRNYAYKNAESQRKNDVLSQVPRHAIEIVSIGGILLIIIVKLIGSGDLSNIVTPLSAFAVASFRLLPSANRISFQANTIVFQSVSIDLVYHDLKMSEEGEREEDYQVEEKKRRNFKVQLR